MMTMVDLDEAMLNRAERLALREGRTLSSVLSDALAAYLGARKDAQETEPLLRDGAHARSWAPGEFAPADRDDELTSLQIPAAKRSASR